jgi:uncharacterized protein (TIGR04255 family)
MPQPKYFRAPVFEAVCEFRFLVGGEWDATIPGLLYTKLQAELPKRKTVSRFQLGAGKMTLPQGEAIGPTIEFNALVQFLSDDERRFIQVAPNYLSVHALAPYQGWENFKTLIDLALREYLACAPPRGFQRIGLRYINRIALPEVSIEFADFFNFYPHLAPTLPQHVAVANASVVIPFFDGRDTLRMQLRTPEPAELPDAMGSVTLMLDLDYALIQSGAIEIGPSVHDWIGNAHKIVGDVFEECITPRTRETFGIRG